MTELGRPAIRILRRGLCVAAAWLVLPPALAAQASPTVPDTTASRAVTGTAEVYLGLTASEHFHPLFIAAATWNRVRVEGRYNYEDDRTASLFIGYEFETTGRPALWLAPMIGGVVGTTDGIAPALEIELTLDRFTFYDESEVVFTFGEGVPNFFYSWGTATYEIRPWLRPGLAVQRLRVFGSDREVDPGIVSQSTVGALEVSLYGFNLFDSDRSVQLGLSVSF
jgi:hypothetical protein